MAWSTRQLADLAGVSLRSIRHWHDVGILPEPDRLANSYKQYTALHLVLTLRIKRLAGLGFSLERIAEMLASASHADASLQELREELTGTITRLELIRTDLDRIIAHGIAPDLSPEALRAMEAFGRDETGRGIAIVFAHLFPAGYTDALADALAEQPVELGALNTEFTQLTEDASAQRIATMVTSITVSVGAFLAAHPELISAGASQKADKVKADAFTATILDGLNRAQREVMSRTVQHLATVDAPPEHRDS